MPKPELAGAVTVISKADGPAVIATVGLSYKCPCEARFDRQLRDYGDLEEAVASWGSFVAEHGGHRAGYGG